MGDIMQNLVNANGLNFEAPATGMQLGERRQFSYSANSMFLASVESTDESTRSTQAFFRSDRVSLSIENSGHRVFAQALNISMSAESVAVGAEPAAKAHYGAIVPFQPPSPAEVANNVLSFVENRLQSEAESGSSPDKIADLLSQAREGVEKGFAMARNDIESLGLMNDDLASEIDESFSLIDAGLKGLESKYIANNDALVREHGDLDSPEENALPASSGSPVNAALVKQNEQHAIGEVRHVGRANTVGAWAEASSYMQIGSEFSLTTQDGDNVSIRFAQVDAAYFQGNVQAGSERYFYASSQFEGYQINVQGDLDEGEVSAINDLLSQVGEISDLFFGGEFQQAFSAALNVGFDASEIAAFSLNLSKVQVEEVSVYGDFKPDSTAKALEQNQPLIEMVNRLGYSVDVLKQFESQQFDFRDLLLEFIERETDSIEAENSISSSDFSQFASRALELLTS